MFGSSLFANVYIIYRVKIQVNHTLTPWKFFYHFLSSADFFQNQLFRKNLSGIPSECQTDWIQIGPDILSGPIWIQSVCKGYQRTALVDKSWLKVHLRLLAVNFLPQYFITLLFSLTCFQTITRRKRPKSGPKTRFQSDFYTLLIICVPPIILGQVLRYLPTVVAIYMNSNVTSYDPCADAIE